MKSLVRAIAMTLVVAYGVASAEGPVAASIASKTDTALTKVQKQPLTKRSASTSVPKPTTNWSKIKDLFL
jgi:hypothetical protein